MHCYLLQACIIVNCTSCYFKAQAHLSQRMHTSPVDLALEHPVHVPPDAQSSLVSSKKPYSRALDSCRTADVAAALISANQNTSRAILVLHPLLDPRPVTNDRTFSRNTDFKTVLPLQSQTHNADR